MLGSFKLNTLSAAIAEVVASYDDYLLVAGGASASFTPKLYGLTDATFTFSSLTTPAWTSPGWGSGVHEISFNPQGTILLHNYSNVSPYINVYSKSGSTLTPVGNLDTGEYITAFSWNGDGSHMVCLTGSTGTIKHYTVSGTTFTAQTNIATVTGYSASTNKFKQSPQGHILLTSTSSPFLRGWTTSNYSTYTAITGMPTASSSSPIAWHPSGKFFAVQTTSTVLNFYFINSSNAAVITNSWTVSAWMSDLAWDPTGTFICGSYYGGALGPWMWTSTDSINQNAPPMTALYDTGGAYTVSWNSDGTQLVFPNSFYATAQPTFYTRSGSTFTRQTSPAAGSPGFATSQAIFSGNGTVTTVPTRPTTLTIVGQNNSIATTGLTLPAGTQAGDIVFYNCARSVTTAGSVALPTGWTGGSIVTASTVVQSMICYKVMTAADITTGTITHTGSTTSIKGKWAVAFRPNTTINSVTHDLDFPTTSSSGTTVTGITMANKPMPAAVVINVITKGTTTTPTTNGSWTGATVATVNNASAMIVFESLGQAITSASRLRTTSTLAAATPWTQQQIKIMVA